MNNYLIILKNKDEVYSESYRSLSFPEAASKAYLIRSHKGHDWEIISVKKENKSG